MSKMNLYVDNREKSLYSLLMAFNFANQSETNGETVEKYHESDNLNVEIKKLELGDIVLCDENNTILLLFERKSINDLASSLYDKRYQEQSSRLSSFSVDNHNIIYIIEGNIDNIYKKKGNINTQTLRTCVVSLNLKKGFSIMKTYSMDDTARWILAYAYKVIKDKTLCEKIVIENSIKTSEKTSETTNASDTENTKCDDETNIPQQTHLKHLSKQTKSSFITKETINTMMLSVIPTVSTTIASTILETFITVEKLVATLREDENVLNNIYITTNGKQRKLGKNVITNIKNMLL